MSKKKLPRTLSPTGPVMQEIKKVLKRPRSTNDPSFHGLAGHSPKSTLAGIPVRRGGKPRGDFTDARRDERPGKLVWRKPGAGADLDRPPMEVEVNRADQQDVTDLQKLARTARWHSMQREASAKGVAAHRRRATSPAAVRAYAKQHTVKETAKQYHVTPRRVRQILKEK
jgi:hypothetical protein